MDERSESDCTSCKLISGFGFIGIGVYLGAIGSKHTHGQYSRVAITLIGVGFAGVGIARLLGLPPFSRKKKPVTDGKS